jgi:hypothetical protein
MGIFDDLWGGRESSGGALTDGLRDIEKVGSGINDTFDQVYSQDFLGGLNSFTEDFLGNAESLTNDETYQAAALAALAYGGYQYGVGGGEGALSGNSAGTITQTVPTRAGGSAPIVSSNGGQAVQTGSGVQVYDGSSIASPSTINTYGGGQGATSSQKMNNFQSMQPEQKEYAQPEPTYVGAQQEQDQGYQNYLNDYYSQYGWY